MSCVTSWACLASWVCPSSWHQLPSSKILNVCISAASHWPGGTPSQEPVLNPHAHQRCRWSEVVVGKRPSAIISFASCHTSSGTSPRGVGSVFDFEKKTSMRPLRGRCSSCRRWGRWLRLQFRKEDVVDVGKMTVEPAALSAPPPAHRA